MQYSFIQSLVFGIGAFLVTLLVTPGVKILARRIGAMDRECHRGIHGQDSTPLLGGLAVALPVLVGSVFILIFSTSFSLSNFDQLGLLALIFGCTGMLLLGIVDDLKGLDAQPKFLGQFAMAAVASLGGNVVSEITLPMLGTFSLPPLAGIACSIFWIVGITNALNLIDGVDGLASGVALIAALGLGALALMHSAPLPALFCLLLAAGLAAFLIYNFNPASIFLGDTGSLFIGYLLANLALHVSRSGSGVDLSLGPILILALPIMDTGFAILRRLLRGRPLFRGDRAHLHHRLLKSGYSQRQTVSILCAYVTGMTSLALALEYIPTHILGVSLFAVCGIFLTLALLRNADLGLPVLVQLTRCRQRNRLFGALARYVRLRLASELRLSSLTNEKILWFIAHELSLRSISVEFDNGNTLLASDEQDRPMPHSDDQPLRRMKVRIAHKRVITIQYQTDPLLDETTQADIEACLAGIFEHLEFSPAEPGCGVPAHTLPARTVHAK